jgi:crotonobetainyl-CoA:carnitine CoA-transferase CaiB-like acyl-CoA transferase
MRGVGLDPSDSGGAIEFHGRDPVLPSPLRLGLAAAVPLVAKSAAVAQIWRMRGGPGQDISMDLRVAPHRMCPFYDRRWELLNGHPPGNLHTPAPEHGFPRTQDGRWVMPVNPYPHLRNRVLRLLEVPDDRAAVARAVARWQGRELEDAVADAGAVLTMLRSPSELFSEPHFALGLADLPLVEIVRIADSDPEPFAPGAGAPLEGLRALGMGHVIAGAAIGRALALHGADVLNLWRPEEPEIDVRYCTANVGVRSATLEPRQAVEMRVIRDLLSGADVFYANRRAGYLERLGLSAEECATVRPGIVHVTVSLNGRSGPWAGRSGFDQSAGSLVGIMNLEGDAAGPALPPIIVLNDYVTSWLAELGVLAALICRATEGGSYRVHVSLTRVALWILTLGIFDRGFAHATAGSDHEHTYLEPETFTARTPLGRYQGVTDQVRMSATPGHYRFPLEPRGASDPVWLTDGLPRSSRGDRGAAV